MKNGNLILILLLFVFFSCRSEKSRYSFRGSPNFYFQPNFLDTVEYEGVINKNGIAEGEWDIKLTNRNMSVNLEYDSLLKLDYVIPEYFELKKKISNGFVWYTYKDESIMIVLDTVKSSNLTEVGIIIDEVSGISQICGEDSNCTPVKYAGNIIEYEENYFSGIFHFRESISTKSYNKLGYVTSYEDQLILFIYQFPYSKNLELSQSLFTLLIENLFLNKKNLVPLITEYKSMKAMNFSEILKNI